MQSFISSLSRSDWLDIIGILLVAFGVFGELVLIFDVPKKLLKLPYNPTNFPPLELRKKWCEILCAAMVAIGLALEVAALPQHIEAAARLNREAGDARTNAADAILLSKQVETTNAQLWAANLVLQTNVNETKTQLANAEARLNKSLIDLKNMGLPMDIGDQYSLAMDLKPLTGTRVELRSAVDTKAQETAESLFSTFFMAGWPVINRALIGDIGESGVIIGYGSGESSEKAAHLLLKLLTERGVPSKIIDPFGNRVRGVPTNAIIVAVCQRPSQLETSLMQMEAKEEELLDQPREISPRIFALSTNRYVIGSKEMAAAQAEYNDLNSKVANSINERLKLSEQIRNLEVQVEVEDFGTNSSGPGIHINGTTFSGNGTLIGGPGATNSNVFMNRVRIDPPPLQ
jgi:hypothetical protein